LKRFLEGCGSDVTQFPPRNVVEELKKTAEIIRIGSTVSRFLSQNLQNTGVDLVEAHPLTTLISEEFLFAISVQ
jgi:hypothetical protein